MLPQVRLTIISQRGIRMARQPIEKLQGYGQVSTPSARPVDSFTGAPSLPQESSGAQLANALGKFSSGVARAVGRDVANQKVEKEKLDAMKASAYAARFEGEEGEFLDSVKLGETYADLSQTVVATIVEDKHYNDYYNTTYDKLRNLDDDVKGDVVALEAMFDGLITEANTATEGMDFVNSGAIQGTQAAVKEMRREFSVFRDQKTRELAKTNTTANVFNILDNHDPSTTEGQTSSVALINNLNEKLIATSPFSKREDKQQIVDSLIQYNKNNPESNAIGLIKRVPWLQSKETDAKLAEAGPQIAELSIAATKRKLYKESVEREELLSEKQGVLNQLAEENDIEKIQQVQAEYAGAGNNPAEKATANAIYEMAVIAEKSAQVEADVSSTNYTLAKEDLTVRASLGTAGSSKEEIAAINARTDISPTQKAQLIQEVPTLIQGNKIIASEQHSTAFRQRFGSVVDTYKTNPMLAAKAFELTQRGLSAETIAKDTWDFETQREINLHIENNKEIPGYNDLYKNEGIYEKAGERVLAKLQEVATLQAKFIQLDSQPQQQPQEQPEASNEESPYSATFINNGIEYGLPVGINPATATDDDWVVVGESGVIEETRDVEAEKRLANLVTTVFRAENDPSLTQNKGSRSYIQAVNELKSIPQEDLDAFIAPLAEQAIAEFTERLNPDADYAFPYTRRSEVRELIEKLRQNPANIFSDNTIAERFLNKTLK